MRRRYDWKPDLPDARDHYAVVAPFYKSLPKKVDLRDGCSAVEDQGDLGSCTAHAIAGALEFLDRRAGDAKARASRLFIYYQERVLEGTVKEDSGAQIRDGVKACAKIGAPKESLCPYVISRFAHKPSARAYADALTRKISEYQRVHGLRSLKTALAGGLPVAFGFSVYESFESDEVAQTGVVPMPSDGERLLGGHAVLCVGYDDTRQRIIVRNSWGAAWGQNGYFTMPYDYVTNADLSDDFWLIRK